MKKKYNLTGEVWIYPGEVAWHFVSVDRDASGQMRKDYKDLHRGFSSLPVTVTVGQTSWQTSVFYESKSARYILPLKAQVRKKENILAKDKIEYTLSLRI